ncbi:hypothetical protein ASG90_15980 [Nocardioides sp. Soil797]|nr:hypothetical protein ASG90_15980 [Nocardioides sp. Soil797]
MESSGLPNQLTVDGERWQVTVRAGQYDFTWLTGVAPGYGFASLLSDAEAVLSRDQVERMIREFMSNVNPETGHLD